MNIVFLSNYFNHHQKPLSDALISHCNYHFVATAEITQERRDMGWGYEREPAYVCHYLSEPDQTERIIAEADVVIAGSAPEKLVQRCIRRGQVVFRYSERPLKNGMEWMKYIPRLVRWHKRNPFWKKIYLLCASGFTAGDYARFGLFRNKAYRWGYFPETEEYEDIARLLEEKKCASILWAGRFLELKHPDDAVAVAAALKADGYCFDMNLIGGGPMEQTLREMIRNEGLEDCVHLLGVMPPEMVRAYMEKTEIFLFTSDRQEGWGAVLNEAMNSGCAVVTSDAIGAVPYLLSDGENGLIYPSESVGILTGKVKCLLEDRTMVRRLGEKAYLSIRDQWNAKVAAERFVNLAEHVLRGQRNPDLYRQGPCSKDIIR